MEEDSIMEEDPIILTLRSRLGIRNAIAEVENGDYGWEENYVIVFPLQLFEMSYLGHDLEHWERQPTEEHVDIARLVTALVERRGARSLHLKLDDDAREDHSAELHIGVLSAAFGPSSGLERLTVSDIWFWGSLEAHENLALRWSNNTLKSLSLDFCVCYRTTNDGSIDGIFHPYSLDPALKKIFPSATLEEFQIGSIESTCYGSCRKTMRHDTIEALCNSPKLRRLNIDCDGSFDTEDFQNLAKHLKKLPQLEHIELSLAFDFNSAQGVILGNAVCTIPNIKTISLKFGSGCIAVEKIHNLYEQGILSTIKSMEHSKCHTLEIHVLPPVVPVVAASLKELLSRNYGLENLLLAEKKRNPHRWYNDHNPHDWYDDNTDPVVDDQIEFFLEMNRQGRGRLFQNSNSTDDTKGWLRMLEAAKGDLTNIYCLISCHPTEFVSFCEKYFVPFEAKKKRDGVLDALALLGDFVAGVDDWDEVVKTIKANACSEH